MTLVTRRCDGMVDVVDSKSTAGDSVPVRVRPPAPYKDLTVHTMVESLFVCPKAEKPLKSGLF